MPAISKPQQKLFGSALAMKRGKQPYRGRAGELAKKLPEEKLSEMASFPNPNAILDLIMRMWWF